MGICLDTESNQAVQEQEDSKGGGGEPARRSAIRSAQSINGNMQNLGKVKFDPPKVPVIFVLGGPGSGKITHCDTLMQEKRGVTHINMMDLLQQYAIGNDMQDFSQLPSKTVTEVLMLEMKMSPAAKTYLVSGYPRSMRDVVEYSEKIQVINGVILISWRQAVLQKQIDYGAKLGHVVLSLAKMELDNFFRNVMPVADYFDQSDMLIAVNGERAPSEVYKDFRAAVLDILGAQENQEALLNGVAGIGRGVDDIPGSIVSVETAPKKPTPPVRQPAKALNSQPKPNSVQIEKIHDRPIQKTMSVMKNSGLDNNLFRIPHVIFVIGGPGSNKAVLCLKAVGMNSGWGHFSVGRLLRAIADSEPKPGTENFAVKEALTAGEMVSKSSLDKLIESNLLQLMDKRGIIIDGYPRDMKQVMDFEDKYNQKPPTILLDCSKLQLGRGRLDDTVSSFRRRLELFRELTLPMLKTLDNAGRLTIIDGDTDSVSVQREFEKVVRQHIQNFGNSSSSNDYGHDDNMTAIGSLYNKEERNSRSNPKYQDTTITDLEDEGMPGAIPTISHHVSMSNGQLGGPAALRQLKMKNAAQNGHIPNGRPNFRNVLEDAEGFPIDSHI